MVKSRRCMVKPWLTVRVDDLDLFVKIASFLYCEHDKERLSSLAADDMEVERGRRWVFRGQRKQEWDIASTLERHHCPGYASRIGLKELEQKLVEEFKREASVHQSFNGWSNLDVLALMRHYEAPTRLVDFSESPFVALYFGIENREPQDDFCVWAVCIDALKEYPKLDDIIEARTTNAILPQQNSNELREMFEKKFWEATDKRSVPNVFYAFPRRGNTRLSAQSGLFLAQCALRRRFMDDLKESLGCRSGKSHTTVLAKIYEKNRESEVSMFSNIVKFVFPHEMGDRCVTLLRSMNISPQKIYPGLEGIGKSLSQYLSLMDELPHT